MLPGPDFPVDHVLDIVGQAQNCDVFVARCSWGSGLDFNCVSCQKRILVHRTTSRMSGM